MPASSHEINFQSNGLHVRLQAVSVAVLATRIGRSVKRYLKYAKGSALPSLAPLQSTFAKHGRLT